MLVSAACDSGSLFWLAQLSPSVCTVQQTTPAASGSVRRFTLVFLFSFCHGKIGRLTFVCLRWRSGFCPSTAAIFIVQLFFLLSPTCFGEAKAFPLMDAFSLCAMLSVMALKCSFLPTPLTLARHHLVAERRSAGAVPLGNAGPVSARGAFYAAERPLAEVVPHLSTVRSEASCRSFSTLLLVRARVAGGDERSLLLSIASGLEPFPPRDEHVDEGLVTPSLE